VILATWKAEIVRTEEKKFGTSSQWRKPSVVAYIYHPNDGEKLEIRGHGPAWPGKNKQNKK
jgi:hypothetical protein